MTPEQANEIKNHLGELHKMGYETGVYAAKSNELHFFASVPKKLLGFKTGLRFSTKDKEIVGVVSFHGCNYPESAVAHKSFISQKLDCIKLQLFKSKDSLNEFMNKFIMKQVNDGSFHSKTASGIPKIVDDEKAKVVRERFLEGKSWECIEDKLAGHTNSAKCNGKEIPEKSVVAVLLIFAFRRIQAEWGMKPGRVDRNTPLPIHDFSKVTIAHVEPRQTVNVEEEFKAHINEFNRNSKLLKNPEQSISKGLMKEMRKILSDQNTKPRKDLEFLVYVNEDNVNHWMVKMINFDQTFQEFPLTEYLKSINARSIVLEMIFTSSYPRDPPFVRVVAPVLTGRAGYVQPKGGLCLEILSAEGWTKEFTITGLLQSIIVSLFESSKLGWDIIAQDYSLPGALEDYRRVVAGHSWGIPKTILSII